MNKSMSKNPLNCNPRLTYQDQKLTKAILKNISLHPEFNFFQRYSILNIQNKNVYQYEGQVLLWIQANTDLHHDSESPEGAKCLHKAGVRVPKSQHRKKRARHHDNLGNY